MPLEMVTTLEGIWFLLAGFFLVGYALTDGFDLGTGILTIFTKKDENRQVLYNAVAPVWDGNEVWLIAGGGMLFAAFPIVYAASFSGFYIAIFLVLWALIGRAVAFEYRNKKESPLWRKIWDWIYWIGNFVPALLFGVAVGNAVIGVPIDQEGVYHGSFWTLLRPSPILMGIVGIFMFLMHGSGYLLRKTEGEVFNLARKTAYIAFFGFIISLILTDFLLVITAPELYSNYFRYPIFWIAPVLIFLGLAIYFSTLVSKKYQKVIYGSTLVTIGTVLTIALASYPVLMRSTLNPQYNLTIWNSASSHITLTVMLVVTLTIMPVVIFYTAYVYRVFKGKVSSEGGYH
ncbi:cytochrome bd-I ubiquinol oxidase subunit 2 apoprotein [Persephonella hydrogeniphila]|uniref:Cytochrome bd-I ubiquinol oxidase subunit 2 apoprotein n=1 Tax=Persephonella hydrogeniphila TaxID=198703 RepID=A0A285NNM9_9AQUI|nr:cytochrome d ubiquinol oxidase subunit II [Persephonella hydrogeniphila]SNZ11065.1 cytochrome bd-I ubiquinol oxidase subunit 2 apoprotein [Persephonella hydrogeniphila]